MSDKIALRNEINEKDKWDLSKLYTSKKGWDDDLKKMEKYIPEFSNFRGKLGDSAESLLKCLTFMNEVDLIDERLGYYAFLMKDVDAGLDESQERMGRYMSVATKISAAGSFITPEIQAISTEKMDQFLSSVILDEFKVMLSKLLRFKDHILSDKEEKLLALQAESSQTASKTFGVLTDVDFEFGNVEGRPLSQSTFALFLIDPDRKLREKAYKQFYNMFDKHKNTVASLYAGSIHQDVYKSKVRNYENSRAAALFPDKVPEKVYDNLVNAVHNNLDSLHKYYDIKKRALKLDKLSHYDVYVPLLKDIKVSHTYEEAVDKVVQSLTPLGEEYCSTLNDGLLNRWVDRYENKGKKSGAYSAGSYVGNPYILMNYKEEVLRDLYTLAHEGGHSMHSWYSVRNNPFQHYNYTIFEAEVASTFNEQLLFKYMTDTNDDPNLQAYLINKQIDDFLATIYRQTMFAEFEALCHKTAEDGNALTVDYFRKEYRQLLVTYFGTDVELLAESDLEGLRIPHFYRAFYVYKYATGLSASVALSQKVLNGGEQDRVEYLNFLKSGGSKYPLESLKAAGVDMSKPEPVDAALKVFSDLVNKLEGLII